MNLNFIVLATVVTTLIFATIAIRRRFFHPLSKFPGPFLASVTNLYDCYWFLRGQRLLWHQRVHEKYGSVVRVAPNHLMVNDHKMLPLIYHLKADKTEYYAANTQEANIFFLQSCEAHVRRRRVLSYAFSSANVKHFEPTFNRLLEDSICTLRRITDEGEALDLNQYISWFVYDTLSEVTFGESVGCTKSGIDVENVLERLNTPPSFLLRVLPLLPAFSWLVRQTPIGRRLYMPKPSDHTGFGVMMGERDKHWNKFVTSGLSDAAAKESLLNRLTSVTYPDGSTMTDIEVRSELLSAIMNGTQGTVIAFVRLLRTISQHPGYVDRIAAEIDEALETQRLTTLPPPFEEARRLPLLTACIREAFRFAPTFAQLPRSSSYGLVLNGMAVPPGMAVSSSPHIIGRDRSLYGDDADTFRPERWLEADEEQLRRWNKYDFNFGYGATICLGKHIATMMVYKATVELFRHFRLEPVPHDETTGRAPSLSGIRLSAR